jgi:hypothetical protein
MTTDLQSLAVTLRPRMAKLREMLGKRKAVCEAQTPGPWMVGAYSNYPDGFSIMDQTGACITERWNLLPGDFRNAVMASAPAIAAQRTERPQELYTLLDMLALLDKALMMADERVILLVDAALKVYEGRLA